MKTQIVGGDTPNQDSVIGAPSSSRWQRWQVLGGLLLCVIAFFAVTALVLGAFGPRQ